MWLVLYLGSPPVPEPRVLDDKPEARVRHAVEELRDGFGSLGTGARPTRAAREQRPDAEQCHVLVCSDSSSSGAVFAHSRYTRDTLFVRLGYHGRREAR